jgi:hypothetical protein
MVSCYIKWRHFHSISKYRTAVMLIVEMIANYDSLVKRGLQLCSINAIFYENRPVY